MPLDKKAFARFLVEEGVLLFGEFTLKSGRQSPHFFNTGKLDSGRALNALGEFFAQRLKELGGCDIVFGPAYKGIPLAVAVAGAYDRLHGTSTGVCFDRKEAKRHADKGLFVGRSPKAGERVILIDDVISSGISLKGAADILKEHFNIIPSFALVAVDRMERGEEGVDSAASELGRLKGVKLEALITLEEVVHELEGQSIGGKVVLDAAQKARVLHYLDTHGAR